MQTKADRMDAMIKHPWFVAIATLFLLAGPFIAMIGNAASDLWLSLIAVFFLARAFFYKEWQWAKEGWFLLALLFWFWMIIASALSLWPEESFRHALPWIRFPVFAMAFAYFAKYSPAIHRATLISFVVAICIMSVVLVIERYNNMDALKLYGTWKQHLKAGWYMIGYGLPILLWCMEKLDGKSSIITVVALLVIVSVTANTGDIYNTLLMIFALGLLFIAQNARNWLRMAFVFVSSGCLAVFGFFFLLGETLQERFIHGLMVRLPWLPSSDYYSAWMGGIRVGLLEPVLGVGADNFDRYCKQETIFAHLDIQMCQSHPHNLYIQTFAELGLVGLCLFVLMGLALFVKVLPLQDRGFYRKAYSWMMLPQKIMSKQAIVLIFVLFWPISSYSEAFGQHKNFFTWLNIGWALALVQRYKIDSRLN
ncbi:MAG: O-antigen ligase family protein [Cohaesibacter sp.]|nr:O-antigen ligase family protein [Cohaesibacter sp.]